MRSSEALRRWTRRLRIPALALILAAPPTLAAEPDVFYGVDQHPGPGEGPFTPRPYADAARTGFLTRLTAMSVEGFEDFAPGAGGPLQVDFGTTTATVTLASGGGVQDGAADGIWPTRGARCLRLGTSGATAFTVAFAEPQKAFGCHLTDLDDAVATKGTRAAGIPGGGDVDLGQAEPPEFRITLTRASGPATVLPVATVANPSGTVLFLGVVDETPFTAVTIGWDTATGDDFGVDDLVVAAPGLPPSVATVDSFILPRKIALKLDAKRPERSTLLAIGTLDLGAEPADLTKPATFQVGGLVVEAPGLTPDASGSGFRYVGDGVDFSVRTTKSRSSKGRFRLAVKRDLTGLVAPDGDLTLRFASEDLDAHGEFELTDGSYRLGKARGALVAPDAFLYRIAGTLKGGEKDKFVLSAGLASRGLVPLAAPDVTVGFGESFEQTVAGADFVQKGALFVYTSKTGAIRKLTLDYAKERMQVTASGVALGDVADGDVPLVVRLVVGVTDRTVRVRAVHAGSALKY